MKVFLFVESQVGRPRCAYRWESFVAYKLTDEVLAIRRAAVRWWLVKCKNQPTARALISANVREGDAGSDMGWILDSGEREGASA